MYSWQECQTQRPALAAALAATIPLREAGCGWMTVGLGRFGEVWGGLGSRVSGLGFRVQHFTFDLSLVKQLVKRREYTHLPKGSHDIKKTYGFHSIQKP